MEQKEKLIWMLSLLMNPQNAFVPTTAADYLLEHDVIVLPCRCGECESFSNGLCDNEHIGAMVFRMKREETDFCSYGKRKGGDK